MLQQLSTLGTALLLAAVVGVGVGLGLWWDHRGPDDAFSRIFPSLQAQRDAALAGEQRLTTALDSQSASLVALAARGRQVVAVQEPGVTRYVQALPAVRQKLAAIDAAGRAPAAAGRAPAAAGPVQVGGGPMECAEIEQVDDAFLGTLRP